MRKNHESERTERTLRPVGRMLEKAGMKEVAHSYLERRRRRQEKRARHKEYRRQLREQQAAETVQATAAE